MQTVFGKKNKKAVSPVIGTILMVAITVVLAAVLYVMVSGIGPGSTSNPPTAQLQAGTWGGNATTASYSVVVITVKDVGGIDPSTLKYVVAKSDNTPCYSGVALQNLTLCTSFTVNVRYQDTTTAGSISPSDSIQVTVSPGTGNPLTAGKLTIQTTDDKIVGTVVLS